MRQTLLPPIWRVAPEVNADSDAESEGDPTHGVHGCVERKVAKLVAQPRDLSIHVPNLEKNLGVD